MAVSSSGTASVAESGPGSVAPPGRMLKKDLAGLDDRALLGIVRLLPQASELREAACELLVARHQGLVWSCVRRYMSGPEPAEDLMQVGYVGLLKAISNFDPAAGASLATYAEDPRLEHMLGMQAVAAHWGELPAREQKILLMDFRGGMTQAQIGQRLCISQMYVSRLRAHALGYLRSRLLDLEEHASQRRSGVAPQPPRGNESAETVTCWSPWDKERK